MTFLKIPPGALSEVDKALERFSAVVVRCVRVAANDEQVGNLRERPGFKNLVTAVELAVHLHGAVAVGSEHDEH